MPRLADEDHLRASSANCSPIAIGAGHDEAASSWKTVTASCQSTIATTPRARAARAEVAPPCAARHRVLRLRSCAGSAVRRAGRSRTGAHASKNSGVFAELARVRSLRSPHVDDVADAAGPRRHHHDPVGEEHRLGDRVGDEDHGGAGLGADPHQLGLHALAGHLVERAERLVHQQQPRPLGERPGDRDALLHAARELVGVPVGEVGEADQLEQLGDARRARGAVDAVQLERQLDVRRDRAPRQQARLLEGDAVVLVEPGLPRAACRRPSIVPPVGLVEVGDQAQQRALAAAARPDQRDELAGGDVEVDVVERVHVVVLAGAERSCRRPARVTAGSAADAAAVGRRGSAHRSPPCGGSGAAARPIRRDDAGGDEADRDRAEDRAPRLGRVGAAAGRRTR